MTLTTTKLTHRAWRVYGEAGEQVGLLFNVAGEGWAAELMDATKTVRSGGREERVLDEARATGSCQTRAAALRELGALLAVERGAEDAHPWSLTPEQGRQIARARTAAQRARAKKTVTMLCHSFALGEDVARWGDKEGLCQAAALMRDAALAELERRLGGPRWVARLSDADLNYLAYTLPLSCSIYREIDGERLGRIRDQREADASRVEYPRVVATAGVGE